jgi:helix-turn-helix protein
LENFTGFIRFIYCDVSLYSVRAIIARRPWSVSNVKGAKALTTGELEQAKVLSAAGKSYRQIGRELQRSDKTIKRALTQSPQIIAQVIEIKEQLATMFEGVAKRMIASITDEDIVKLDGYRRILSARIAVDKASSLRGQADAGQAVSIRIQIVGPQSQPDIVVTPIDKPRNLLSDAHDEEGGPFV